jgi:hypothetical protein
MRCVYSRRVGDLLARVFRDPIRKEEEGQYVTRLEENGVVVEDQGKVSRFFCTRNNARRSVRSNMNRRIKEIASPNLK